MEQSPKPIQLDWNTNLAQIGGETAVRQWLKENRATTSKIEDQNYHLWQTLSGSLLYIDAIEQTFHQEFNWDVTPMNLAEKAKTAFDAAKKAAGK